MKITEKQAEQIFREEGYDENNKQVFKIVEELDWDDDGKYSHGGRIFEFEGKNYQLSISRSGSYHTDYYFDFTLECQEVEQVTITRKVWNRKK